MKKIIKKLQKQINKLNKQFAIFKNKYYNMNIQNNFVKEIIMNKKKQITIFDVADYIIKNKNISNLTNLKLQKLIFYIYSLYLVKTKTKLFDSYIEAWPYGPVFPELYFELKHFKNTIIDKIENLSVNKLNTMQQKCIDCILKKYGHLKAWQLADQTHKEDPWKVAFTNDVSFDENAITDLSIIEYYHDFFIDLQI